MRIGSSRGRIYMCIANILSGAENPRVGSSLESVAVDADCVDGELMLFVEDMDGSGPSEDVLSSTCVLACFSSQPPPFSGGTVCV